MDHLDDIAVFGAHVYTVDLFVSVEDALGFAPDLAPEVGEFVKRRPDALLFVGVEDDHGMRWLRIPAGWFSINVHSHL